MKTANVKFLFFIILFLSLITACSVQAQSWSLQTSGTTNDLYDLWGTSGHDVFAVGASGTILHYNGASWAEMESGVTFALKKIAGESSTEVYAVGDEGTVLQYNGAAWSVMSLPKPSKAFSDIWGTDNSHLFTVGAGGAIEKVQFLAWVVMNSSTSSNLRKVWGSTPKDVFAVGDSGTIVHYDGNTGNNWAVMNSGSSRNLYGVWGNSGSDAFAAGAGGEILHYNGTAWSAMASPSTSDLADIRPMPGGIVFAVGTGGIILRYDGTAWSAMASPSTSNLNRVWGPSRGEAFAVGENGTILHYLDSSTTTTVTAGAYTPPTTGQSVSTTTSIYSNSATDTAPRQCPFRRSCADGACVQSLRELRNRQLHTSIGAMFAAMYYQNMTDIAAILKNNDALNARFTSITSRNMPAVRALVRHGAATISVENALEVQNFLIDLQAQAGPKLGMDIGFILRGIEDGWLFEWLGITVY